MFLWASQVAVRIWARTRQNYFSLLESAFGLTYFLNLLGIEAMEQIVMPKSEIAFDGSGDDGFGSER